ncbi:hypothetical protein CANARDRAFT_24135 [[Candida] arabinofermentans NRRL YB-2248]|uniref:Enhancer of polycomb-like protein n=1 Tax=[Candida] arabinofermentans NRRL YB-2248 TaxID=983967 RepID=A0A1E4SXY4_9ASCO|nr:hypothetical protein CANARDRAFT_24135 [[Candida] arabinofermentans NRRL YB-2248]
MVLPSSAGARFRQRKISVKHSLPVWKQRDIPDLELAEQQRELQQFETGVEKGEEEEHHLQAVINASAAQIQGAKVEQVYIPTPDASKVWKDAGKYYHQKFTPPTSYIRFSATVEDTVGCPYCIDEEDEEFLKSMNEEAGSDTENKCSEDEFELVAYRLESVVNEKQPFLKLNPDELMSFQEIKEVALVPDKTDPSDVARTLENQLNIHPFKTLLDAEPTNGKQPRPLATLFKLFGQKIYNHWRQRRIKRLGEPVFPTVKLEDPSQKDDNDPYVCFRRREFRQARKTRRTDTQGAERLQLFYKDLKHARSLLFMVAEREVQRMEHLKQEREVFNLRCQIKNVKRELGIKGEDEDLVTHKKKRIPVPDPEQIKEQQRLQQLEREKALAKDSKKKLSDKEKSKQKLELHLPASSSAQGGKSGTTPQQILLQQQLAEQQQAQQQGAATTPASIQPYVKLPSSKIPDLDLTTVNTVLQDKLEGIKKAVADKLSKRKGQDDGWVNFTDDPYNPYFDIATYDDNLLQERSHLPYSSIASSLYEVEKSREIDFSNILNNNKHFGHEDVVKINAATGQLMKSDKLNHLPEFYDLTGQDSDYADLDDDTHHSDKNKLSISETVFKLRKRVGRNGKLWIDRKRVKEDSWFKDMDFLDYEPSSSESENEFEPAMEHPSSPPSPVPSHTEAENNSMTKQEKKRINVYDSHSDAKRRLISRFEFDRDLPSYQPLDPSKLNQIGNQTQAIRFGCMLLTKAYDNMHHIRQKQIEQHQQRLLAQQKLQKQQQAAAAAAAAAIQDQTLGSDDGGMVGSNGVVGVSGDVSSKSSVPRSQSPKVGLKHVAQKQLGKKMVSSGPSKGTKGKATAKSS